MTDKTEAPERRVTFRNETPETSDVVLCNYCGESLHDVEHGVFWEQTRTHYCEPAKDKRIEELEAERDEIMREALSLVTQWGPLNYPAGVASQIDNMVAGIVARAEAAEAKLAKAVDALERIAHASDVYGVEANAEDQGADTLAYAHKSTCNLARTTLAELKGTD